VHPPKGLQRRGKPVLLDKLLVSQRGPKAGVLGPDEVEDLVPNVLRVAPVAWLAATCGHEAAGAGGDEGVTQPCHRCR
jgi:hypothetical protein